MNCLICMYMKKNHFLRYLVFVVLLVFQTIWVKSAFSSQLNQTLVYHNIASASVANIFDINDKGENAVLFEGEYFDRNASEISINKFKIENLEQIRRNIIKFKNLKKIIFTDYKIPREYYTELDKLRTELMYIDVIWNIKIGGYYLQSDAVSFWPGSAKNRITDEDLRDIKYAKNLEAIDLGHQAVTDLNVFSELKKLKMLILVDNKIINVGPLVELPHLRYLELYVLNRGEIDFSPLASLKELQDLDLLYYGELKNVDFLMNYDNIRRMYLVSCRLSDENYKKLKERYPNIELVHTYDGNANTNGWRATHRYKDMREVLNTNCMTEKFLNYVE